MPSGPTNCPDILCGLWAGFRINLQDHQLYMSHKGSKELPSKCGCVGCLGEGVYQDPVTGCWYCFGCRPIARDEKGRPLLCLEACARVRMAMRKIARWQEPIQGKVWATSKPGTRSALAWRCLCLQEREEGLA